MRIFKGGKFIELHEGTAVFVGTCGSADDVFGENARFVRATAKHLVFETESGTIVKTDMHMSTIGKAAKNHYFVSLGKREYGKNDNIGSFIIHYNVKYWNDKKLCFETR